MSQQQAREEAVQEEYERRLHQQNLSSPPREDDESTTAEILRYLSEIDDLPIGTDDPIMGQLVSKLTSTANLTPEQVRSNEWVREYLLILYLCKHPTKEGMHGSDRAWAHDDVSEYREPLSAEDRMAIESFVTSSKLALTRSEDMEAVKESTRTVSESIVNDDSANSNSGGGILGRFKS